MRNLLSGLLTGCLMAVTLSAGFAAPVSAASAPSFAFGNGKMTKEVLRNYCSRAVTCAGFAVEGLEEDPIFEEDLRMLRRIGAKYIGRAAYYSWSGNLSASQIEKHYATAKAKAALAHRADPEMILQAGVFEIMYRGTVNNTAVPSWVFEAFTLPVQKRNFQFDAMLFPSSSQYALGFWGNNDSAVPDITKTETQMYFYYQICRYIDSGFEAFHLGQAEMMANYDKNNFKHWDKVTTLARAYAEDHARRGVVLFDCHSAIDSPGMKVGERLICDIQGAGLVPNETVFKDGAYQCEIADYRQNWLQWIGRSGGGQHPLGFTVENNFTILEFDNYGGNGQPNIPTFEGFYVWGYDDITWFALQPEAYRNQFLRECAAKLKTIDLDSAGKQQYFLQPSCRRVVTAYPTLTYTYKSTDDLDFLMEYLEKEKTEYTFQEKNKTFTIKVKKDYRCNTQSGACPNGFNQEDTIREIFLGKNAAEDPSLTSGIVPGKTTTAATTTAKKTKTTTAGSGGSMTRDGSTTRGEPTSRRSDGTEETSAPAASSAATTAADTTGTAAVDGPVEQPGKSGSKAWLGAIVAGVLVLLAGGGAALWVVKSRKKPDARE